MDIGTIMSCLFFLGVGASTAGLMIRLFVNLDSSSQNNQLESAQTVPQLTDGNNSPSQSISPYRNPTDSEQPTMSPFNPLDYVRRLVDTNRVTFPTFVQYWKICRWDNSYGGVQELTDLARLVEFDSARSLAKQLSTYIGETIHCFQDEPDKIREQDYSGALMFLASIRQRQADADLFARALRHIEWSEGVYILVMAIGSIWPLPELAAWVLAKYAVNFNRQSSPRCNRRIRDHAMNVLQNRRKEDPELFSKVFLPALINDQRFKLFKIKEEKR